MTRAILTGALAALGERLAALLQAGDTLLLHGPIGAGKSHLARAFNMFAQKIGDMVGHRRILEADLWDRDHLDLVEPASISASAPSPTASATPSKLSPISRNSAHSSAPPSSPIPSKPSQPRSDSHQGACCRT